MAVPLRVANPVWVALAFMEHTMAERLELLESRKAQARMAGGEAAIERHHAKGKLTARERIEYLLDEETFQELDMLNRHYASGMGLEDTRPYTDGVITGFGKIDGRKVCVYSQDFTVFGGALGETHGEKIHKIMDMATTMGVPIIGLNDGAGARIQEGVAGLNAYGGIFYRNAKASGVVPQISVILGPCAGGAVYSPALTDFIFMVKDTSHMFITGPDVVKTVTGEDVTLEELGGALTHATKSGVANFVMPDEKSVLDEVRYLLSFLPSNNMEEPPRILIGDEADRLCENLRDLLPVSPNQPYDMKRVIASVVDGGDYMEVHATYARQITCGFARIDGHSIGLVSNQPQVLAGVLDIESSEKAARFVRTCDAFNIPIVTFVDVPGFMPGVDQEYGGIIRHGAKLLYAFCEATVPRICIITRKAYGGAYVVMNSKSIGADLAFAWPTAELAVMGSAGAVEIVHRRDLTESDDPDTLRTELIDDYEERYATPYIAAERGFIDDVIDPAQTRRVLSRSLDMLRGKREELPKRKHGNVPL
jgi:acetyl-CoA carboxylase carboxyltransferase component